jgi:hypothetical protein
MLQVTTIGEMDCSNTCSHPVVCINSNTAYLSDQVKHGSVSVSLAASNDSQRTVAYEVTADTVPFDHPVQADDGQSACEVDAMACENEFKHSVTGSEQADAGFCSKQSCPTSVSRNFGINSSSAKKAVNVCDQTSALGDGDDSMTHTAIKCIVSPPSGQAHQRRKRRKFKSRPRLMRSQLSHLLAKHAARKQLHRRWKVNTEGKSSSNQKLSLFSNETINAELANQKTSQAVQVVFFLIHLH